MRKEVILHLERKFTEPSETFIVNQINSATSFRHAVFTMKHLNHLKVNADLYFPSHQLNSFDLKFLKKKSLVFFQKKINDINPEVIHSHFLTDASFFASLTAKYNIPKICSCYGYDVTKFPKKFGLLARLYYQRVFKQYDLFLAMSENMRENLIKIGCPPEKIRVHYHGIKVNSFDIERKYSGKDEFTLLTIAQLDPTKGHITTLKSIKRLLTLRPDINLRYDIVGEGPLEEEIRSYIKTENLDQIVRFHGFVKHGTAFNKILSNADVFVHPCETVNGAIEGIPGAIVEAMSAGLPVISTLHGGIPAVINDGKTGFLVKEFDNNKIADILNTLYGDAEKRRVIGEMARDFAAKNLAISQKSKDLEGIYTSLISEKRPTV